MVQITSGEKLNKTLRRLAYEVLERNGGAEEIALLGIQTQGVAIAERIGAEIESIEGVCPPVGSIDVTLYRDDLLQVKGVTPRLTQVEFSLDNKIVVLCDDVLYTGRTVRAAISAILRLGRPKKIQLLVVADRGKRQLPFAADYVGKNVFSEEDEKVSVKVTADKNTDKNTDENTDENATGIFIEKR